MRYLADVYSCHYRLNSFFYHYVKNAYFLFLVNKKEAVFGKTCTLPYRMEVRIHIPRPLLSLTVVGVFVLWWTGIISLNLPGKAPTGGVGGQNTASLITDTTQDIDKQRVMQAVLEKQEDILRYQLSILESETLQAKTPEKIKELQETREALLSIIQQRSSSEKLLRLSLEQLWDAEGTTYSLQHLATDTELDWPVMPLLGVSAHFEDAGYKKRFGIDHHAIDIPVNQGTPIRAPADGVVLKVSMNGLGYSYIVLEHEAGLQTIYGHVSKAEVKEGDHVGYGQVIGRTGGTPGSPGAGLLTTGPHLHFAVKIDGALVDPMAYLPEWKTE